MEAEKLILTIDGHEIPIEPFNDVDYRLQVPSYEKVIKQNEILKETIRRMFCKYKELERTINDKY